MQSKSLFIIIIAVICFGLGFISAKIIPGNEEICLTQADVDNAYKSGEETVKNRLRGLGTLPTLDKHIPTKEISGAILEAGQDKMTVKITPLDPLDDPELDIRIVEITDRTEIMAYLKKDDGQYEEELEEYKQKFEQGLVKPGSDTSPPARYTLESAAISDLAPGQQIVIINSEDFRYNKQFAADKITVYPRQSN